MRTFGSIKSVALALAAVLALSGAARAEDTPLTKAMEVISKNVKKLRAMVKDSAKNTESAAMVRECIDLATKAKDMVPAMAADIPAAQREKFVEEYKKMMADLVATFTELEQALKDNKNDVAQEVYAKLLDMKKKGHEKFTPQP